MTRRLFYSPSSIVKVPNLFGDGSDSDATITGTTTLTEDMFYRNLTIAGGGVLVTSGFRVFVSGVLLNLGTIRNNGSGASGATAGSSVNSDMYGNGTLGGAGRSTAGVGNSSALAAAATGVSATGHQAGSGGSGGTNAGGSGGSPQTDFDLRNYIRNAIEIFSPTFTWQGTKYTINAGGSGGGGGNDTGAGTVSGGGGGGGGVILISAKILNNGSGTIEAKGGAGGAASGAGNAGGGGGGGGGSILLCGIEINQGTLTASGGAGGAKVGTGVAGQAGTAGASLVVKGA